MKLSKSLTTVTLFSKTLAISLFIILPFMGFLLGGQFASITIQSNTDKCSATVNNNTKIINPTPTPTPVNSLSREKWYRYMSRTYDYYLDYPNDYSSNADSLKQITFQKKLEKPGRNENYIFIYTGTSSFYDEENINRLINMSIGEIKVIQQQENSLLNEYFTYQRLPDEITGNKKVKSYIQKKVFEASENTTLHLYIYEGKQGIIYTFGGLINDTQDATDNISRQEFRNIISTLTFLD